MDTFETFDIAPMPGPEGLRAVLLLFSCLQSFRFSILGLLVWGEEQLRNRNPFSVSLGAYLFFGRSRSPTFCDAM